MAREPGEVRREARCATSWTGLIALSSGLAIDNVVVGFSLGLREVQPLLIPTLIGASAVAFTLAGPYLGRVSRRSWQTSATVVAGLLLIAIGMAVACDVL